jgi:hypothetical protein
MMTAIYATRSYYKRQPTRRPDSIYLDTSAYICYIWKLHLAMIIETSILIDILRSFLLLVFQLMSFNLNLFSLGLFAHLLYVYHPDLICRYTCYYSHTYEYSLWRVLIWRVLIWRVLIWRVLIWRVLIWRVECLPNEDLSWFFFMLL